jgi:hypothetical protein
VGIAHDATRSGLPRLAERHDVSLLERFCSLLTDAGVEFIVVGGQAEILMGGARVTYDVDLCFRRTTGNLERLAATLRLTLPGAPPDLTFPIDARALALGQNFTFEVDGEHALDLWSYLEPVGTYDDVLPRAETVIKRYLRRPKDQASLVELEAIKRLREQEGLR